MKDKNKILHFFVIFVIIMLLLVNISFAEPIIPSGVGPEIENQQVHGMTSSVLGTFRYIGYAIAIGALMFVGIKYITSSADERATLKGVLVKVVIGIVVILAAEVIVSIIYNFNS